MTVSSIFTFTFAVFLVNLCWAQDVTVFLNDTSFVTTPPNWSGTLYSALCGGSRWTSQMGQTVSMSFTGTDITVNFILEYAGAIAQVTLDGSDLVHINTFVSGQPDAACTPYAWHSGNLTAGQHTITITQLGSGNPANPSVVYVWLQSFVYASSPDPSHGNPNPASTIPTTSITTSAPTQTTHKMSPKAGAVAGAVMGSLVILLLVVGVLWYRRRQRQRLLQPSPLLIEAHNFRESEKPTVSPTESVESKSLASQGGAFYGDGMSMMPVPIQHSDRNSNWSSTQSSQAQGGAVGSSKPALRLLDPGSPPTSPPTSPSNQRLTQSQLEFVHHLSKQNVPGPALATVIDSLASGTQFSAGETELGTSGQEPPLNEEDAPPGYSKAA